MARRSTLGYGDGPGVIELINGADENGTVLAQTTVNNTGLVGIFTNFSVVFTTGSTVSNDLIILLGTTTAIQISFDNVRLDATVAALRPVGSAPTFSPAAAYPGDAVTATEVATGPGPLYYQWQADDGSGGVTWTTVTGFSLSPTYTFSTTGDTDPTYEYRVVVSNSYGTVTSAAGSLTITNGAPIVLQNPVPQVEYFMVGETASFSTAFDGTPPISYQWQVDDGGGPVNVTDGTYNSNILVITNVQLSDEGIYTCIASNSYGTATNADFGTLNVSPQPGPDSFGNIVLEDTESSAASYQPTYVLPTDSLISGEMPSAVGPGGPAAFQTEGCAGIPVLTDGLYPPTGDNYEIMAAVGDNGGTTLTYSLNTAVAPLGYNLTSVIAYGGWLNGGRDQMAANVYYSQVSSVSDSTNFIQFGTYDFLPNYANNPASRVTLLPSSGYMATNVAAVEFDFTGQNVENGYEGLAELQIFGQAVPIPADMAPVLEQNIAPSTVVIQAGSSISFSAVFAGSPPITNEWQFNGNPVSNGGRISGATTDVLTINDVQVGDAGAYQLFVTNAFGGNQSSQATLTVVPTVQFNGGTGWSAQGTSYSWPSSNVLQLTAGTGEEANSAFYKSPLYIDAFEASFSYLCIPETNGFSADGVTFCIQDDSSGPAALGADGGGLGVDFPAITPSVEFEFQVYVSNGIGVAIDSGGNIGPFESTAPVILNSGDWINTVFTYQNGVATATLTDTNANTHYSISSAVNIPAVLGTNVAYVGFTGSDGGYTSTQRISNFSFVNLLSLSAQVSGGNLLLSWPVANVAYTLQQSPVLGPSAIWTPVAAPVALVNGQNQVTVPLSGTKSFYRLVTSNPGNF